MKIATYNVENLFDLKTNGHEYKEYIPYGKSLYNDRAYKAKLRNISQVIRDIDADIIALQEIESREAFNALRLQLKQDGLYYPYAKIADRKNTTVKVAIFSKIPFLVTREILTGYAYAFRNILEAKFQINGEELYIFVNHWKAKTGPESERITYAKALKKRLNELQGKNIVALGDFNSNHNECQTFKRKRKLNNTNGKTGINHILGSINYQKDLYRPFTMKSSELYNLWYDIDEEDRFSYIFHGKNETPDNILISSALLDTKGLEYKRDSLHNFVKPYLFKRGYPYRWQMRKGATWTHKAKGYSDHLAVVAKFTY